MSISLDGPGELWKDRSEGRMASTGFIYAGMDVAAFLDETLAMLEGRS